VSKLVGQNILHILEEIATAMRLPLALNLFLDHCAIISDSIFPYEFSTGDNECCFVEDHRVLVKESHTLLILDHHLSLIDARYRSTYLKDIAHFYDGTVYFHLNLFFFANLAISIVFHEPGLAAFNMLAHYGNVTALHKAVESFTLETDALVLVNVISCTFVKTLWKSLKVLFTDSISVVDHIKALSTEVEKTHFDLLGIVFKTIFEKLRHPNSELLVKVLDGDIARVEFVVKLPYLL